MDPSIKLSLNGFFTDLGMFTSPRVRNFEKSQVFPGWLDWYKFYGAG